MRVLHVEGHEERTQQVAHTTQGAHYTPGVHKKKKKTDDKN